MINSTGFLFEPEKSIFAYLFKCAEIRFEESGKFYIENISGIELNYV